MGIRRRGRVWQIDYTDITGKRMRQSGFRTKADAEIALSQATVNTGKGLSNIIDKNITVKDACLYFYNRYAMRRGELLALRWANVDFKNNKIRVTESEYKGKKGDVKTLASKRNINIPDNLRKVLIEQKLKTGSSEYVFPNTKGGMYEGHNINHRMFNPLVKACNIGHFRFHDLRHTFGSHLVENGINIKYTQAQMGHSRAGITLDIYTHVLPDANEKAMHLLNELYS